MVDVRLPGLGSARVLVVDENSSQHHVLLCVMCGDTRRQRAYATYRLLSVFRLQLIVESMRNISILAKANDEA